VREQIEEETLVNNLIDNFGLAAQQPDHANLYALDRDMTSAPQEIAIPREEKV
jgi:ferritin